MNERKESKGRDTTNTDPLQRSSGTAGGMAGEPDKSSGGDLAGMNEKDEQVLDSMGIGTGTERGIDKTIGQAVGEKIDSVSGKMTGGIEIGKEKLGGSMESAADKLRGSTADRTGLPHEAGTALAETMDRTAGYLHERSSAQIWKEVEQYVREHPTRALVGAVVTGWVIARVLR